MAQRFRGFLPIIIDVETGGFNASTDALLEIAAVTLEIDGDGYLHPAEEFESRLLPFDGANLEPAALAFTGIDPYDPDRNAVTEDDGLKDFLQPLRRAVKDNECNRAILVAHNAHFDLGFVNAAIERNNIKRNPFHPFSCFDTATLAGMAYGHTVLAKACQLAGIEFDNHQAHSALYDARKTAELFCKIHNSWHKTQPFPYR